MADRPKVLTWNDLFADQARLTWSAHLPTDFSTGFAESILRIDHLPVPYLNVFHAHIRSGIFGEGSSTDANVALRTSIFEAFERHSAGIYEGLFVRGSFNDLSDSAIDPRELVLLTDEEYAAFPKSYVRYDENLPLNWLPCFEITKGSVSERLVPASLTILRYGWTNREERIAPILSSGTASGETFAQAILHALYELVERDAFLIAWLSERRMRVLPAGSLGSPDLAASLARLLSDQFQVRFADMTSNLGIPAYMAAIGHPMHPDGAMVFGLGANLSPRRARERAYVEAVELLVNFFSFSDSTIRPRRVRTLSGLLPSDYFRRCQFLFETDRGPAERRAEPELLSVRKEMEACLTLLGKRGLRLYFADLTPLNLPRTVRYRLVRVFVSWLQPHVYELDAWRLANPRLSASTSRKLDHLRDPFAANQFARWIDPR